MLIFRGVNVQPVVFKKHALKIFGKKRWFSKPPHMGYNFSGTCMALEDLTFLDRLIWSRTHGKVVPCDKWNATLQGFRDDAGPSFGKPYTSMNLSHDKFPVITFNFMLVWGTFAGICVAKKHLWSYSQGKPIKRRWWTKCQRESYGLISNPKTLSVWTALTQTISTSYEPTLPFPTKIPMFDPEKEIGLSFQQNTL